MKELQSYIDRQVSKIEQHLINGRNAEYNIGYKDAMLNLKERLAKILEADEQAAVEPNEQAKENCRCIIPHPNRSNTKCLGCQGEMLD